MAITNTKLQITDLDFDTIKSNLKTFLQGQSELTDYDFSGSALSVLLDVLSYTTHYNSYYLNMVANEMFLDSAGHRDSVVSIAKNLGYVPSSILAATATVNLTITSSVNTGVILPQYTKFTASDIETDQSYIFVTDVAHSTTTYTTNGSNYDYTINNVKLKEGFHNSFSWIVNQEGIDQRYVLPQAGIDTSTLTVEIKSNSSSTTKDKWELYDNVSSLGSDKQIYFIQEAEDEKFEVYFGDGTFGKKLSNGNVIESNYIVTNGIDANGLGNFDTSSNRVFTISDSIANVSSVVVSVVTPATGGTSSAESIESIKYLAPKTFQDQNRAVTLRDYQSIILRDYPNAQAVSVTGGEDMNPPEYGSVVITVKPVTGYTLTNNAKQDIIDNILDKHRILAVKPRIIDPDYIFVTVNSKVKYNPSTAVNTEDSIKDLVVSTIKTYNSNEVEKFDGILRHSKLVAEIDNTDNAIRSNVTDISLKKRIKPTLNLNEAFTLDYNQKFDEGKLESSYFSTDNIFTETTNQSGEKIVEYTPVKFSIGTSGTSGTSGSNGISGTSATVVRNLNLVDGLDNIKQYNVGTVNHETGIITLSGLNYRGILDGTKFINLVVKYLDQDVVPNKTQIVSIYPSDITVTMIKDTTD